MLSQQFSKDVLYKVLHENLQNKTFLHKEGLVIRDIDKDYVIKITKKKLTKD